MRNFLLYISCWCVLCNCSGNKSEDSLRFFKAATMECPEDIRPLADSLFQLLVPIIPDQEEQFIFVANPECSFCIATAISCCNAWAGTGSTSPFYFLIKSDYTELFEFYLDRDCKKRSHCFHRKNVSVFKMDCMQSETAISIRIRVGVL